MSRKEKPKKRDYSTILDEFKFEPSGLDLKLSRNLITVMDGYRINRTYDIAFVDRAIKEGGVPKSFVRQWGVIRSVLHKLAAIGPKVPGVERWLNLKQLVSFAAMALLTVAAPLLLLQWVFYWDWLAPYAVPLAIIAFGFVMFSWLTSAWFNRKVAWAIWYHLEQNPQLVAREVKLLREWVQSLIYHYARLLRKEHIDAEKALIKFFNDDYEGITVLKEPQGLRKHYTVQIQTGRLRETPPS